MNTNQLEPETIDYTRQSQKWHSDTPEHTQAMKNFWSGLLLPYLPSDKNIHVLDVGCGMGFALMSLQDMGYKVIEGIDIDQGQVESCRSKKLNVTRVDDSVTYLSEKTEQYDLIIALDVIEHMPKSAQLNFVRSIQRSIKPGGKFICTVPNANAGLAGRWQYDDWTHYDSFTEHSLDFLLYNSGFTEIQVNSMEFFQPPTFKLISLNLFRRSFWKSVIHWQLFRFVRTLRRIEMIAELGWEQGEAIPLSLNILATSVKSL
jgi:2-polyprenyl-3-methyl-5-hydroxy-6-metoxy-1,4-benzoquinol methylase